MWRKEKKRKEKKKEEEEEEEEAEEEEDKEEYQRLLNFSSFLLLFLLKKKWRMGREEKEREISLINRASAYVSPKRIGFLYSSKVRYTIIATQGTDEY